MTSVAVPPPAAEVIVSAYDLATGRPCHPDVLLAIANTPPEAGRSRADP